MMNMGRRLLLAMVIGFISCFLKFGWGATHLPDDEVETLRQIFKALGMDWNSTADPCNEKESGWNVPDDYFVNCTCSQSSSSSNICHVDSIMLKSQSLPGVLPRELVKLPELRNFDVTRNYISGTIPKEWASLKSIITISVLGNRLSGHIPKEIGEITSLKELNLEANQFSGVLPPELGNLVGLVRLLLSSNNFTGELPKTLSKLANLTQFVINDNQFIGKIPSFIHNWTKLEKLYMQASGLEGPIPSGISLLEKLTDLRISDINGPIAAFPPKMNMSSMKTLILRSCNINGTIPDYLGAMTELQTLDLSFNKLKGPIPSSFSNLSKLNYLYLTGNLLIGPVPTALRGWVVNIVRSIDLSYNSVSLSFSREPSCHQNLNLFGSSSLGNNSAGSCWKSLPCLQYSNSFHINCGGEGYTKGSKKFDADLVGTDSDLVGASKFYNSGSNWVSSRTGQFLDNNNRTHTYIARKSDLSFTDSQLYSSARLSPLSITYYGYCLKNGSYTVSLHFAEIMFSNNESYSSLGRRIFNVYIQGELRLKDFNIAKEAGGVGKPVIKTFTEVVSSGSLDVRFYWAGKGTEMIPERGTYGPLISAISVDPNFKVGKRISAAVVVGIVVSSLACLIFIILGLLWWRGCLGQNDTVDHELRGLDLNTGSFTLRQIKAATNNFDRNNKIGEGGFGPVYKGILSDGTVIAVKQLSSKSKQGNREFVTEIGMISALQHPNLVRLYGCCIEGNQLLLIYEYLENNSLARALFGPEETQLELDWPTRHKICVGIARGLAYLHEESRLKIVHRDIKGTNILLDKDLNPKISDFGLAKLNEEENTHISTRIAGTIGYMAPEYALRGYLTDKADVYSFGIVALEIVSGRSNSNYRAREDCVYLLDWALVLQEKENLLELVDPKLGSVLNEEEVLGMINIALMCTNASSTLRPTMTTVVSMLEGRTVVEDFVSNPSKSWDDSKFNAIRHYHQQNQEHSMSEAQSISVDGPNADSSTSGIDLYPLIPDSQYLDNRST